MPVLTLAVPYAHRGRAACGPISQGQPRRSRSPETGHSGHKSAPLAGRTKKKRRLGAAGSEGPAGIRRPDALAVRSALPLAGFRYGDGVAGEARGLQGIGSIDRGQGSGCRLGRANRGI